MRTPTMAPCCDWRSSGASASKSSIPAVEVMIALMAVVRMGLLLRRRLTRPIVPGS